MIDKLENKPRPQQFYLWKGFVLCSIIILYQGCSRTSFSLVKEVYQGKLEDLRYYIEFKPHVGW